MSEKLYTLDILRLAAATAQFPRLAVPGATAERRTVTCGSRIVVDLALGPDGCVSAFGQAINACALGQAAATIVARHAIGRTPMQLAAARDAVAHWLGDADASVPDWPGIDALGHARGYPSRHGAIRLPFEAAADAATLLTP